MAADTSHQHVSMAKPTRAVSPACLEVDRAWLEQRPEVAQQDTQAMRIQASLPVRAGRCLTRNRLSPKLSPPSLHACLGPLQRIRS